MTRLLLIRHATTVANEQGLWIGKLESKLSQKGKEELKELKKKLVPWHITGCFSSPSIRTLETAQAVIEGKCPIEKIEALREINFGTFEGKHFKWAQSTFPEEVQKMIEEGNDYCYPGGESLVNAHKRTKEWLRMWLETKPKGNYLICAHGGTIRSILSELLVGHEGLHWHFKVDPASLTIVNLDDDGFAVIETLNQKENSV